MSDTEFLTLSYSSEYSTFLVAKKNIPPNTLLSHYGGCPDSVITPHPSIHSVQLSENRHVECPCVSRFCSHSITPNCELIPFIQIGDESPIEAPININSNEVSGYWLKSKEIIKEGETISFNYNTSEWNMVNSFVDTTTHLLIKGFNNLEQREKKKIFSSLTPYIKEKYFETISPYYKDALECDDPPPTVISTDIPDRCSTCSIEKANTSQSSPLMPYASIKHHYPFHLDSIDLPFHTINITQVQMGSAIGRYLIATEKLGKNVPVGYFIEGTILPHPNMYTVQLDEGRHLESPDNARYAAHSSEPNCCLVAIFDSLNNIMSCYVEWVRSPEHYHENKSSKNCIGYLLVTITEVDKSSSLVWDYNTSEAIVSCQFVDSQTKVLVSGFDNLSQPEKIKNKHLLTPYLLQHLSF